MSSRVKVTSVLPENNLLLMSVGSLEKMWGIPKSRGTYEIDSIPAADPDLNLGDVVYASQDMVVEGIASRGGDVTFHAFWANPSFIGAFRHKRLRRELVGLFSERYQAKFETYDGSFTGISVRKRHKEEVYALLVDAMLQDQIIDSISLSGLTDRWAR